MNEKKINKNQCLQSMLYLNKLSTLYLIQAKKGKERDEKSMFTKYAIFKTSWKGEKEKTIKKNQAKKRKEREEKSMFTKYAIFKTS